MKKKFIEELVFDNSSSDVLESKNKNMFKYNSINHNIKKYEENPNSNCEDFNYKYSNDNFYYKSEIALWKAVILQALVDLQSNSKKKIANTYRIKALMWFNLKNQDFITVCNYAGLDPKYVYKKARIVKENNKFFQ